MSKGAAAICPPTAVQSIKAAASLRTPRKFLIEGKAVSEKNEKKSSIYSSKLLKSPFKLPPLFKYKAYKSKPEKRKYCCPNLNRWNGYKPCKYIRYEYKATGSRGHSV